MYEKIKALCEQRGITIKALEAELNIGNGTIGKWRESAPRTDSLKKVMDYFGVTFEYLTED